MRASLRLTGLAAGLALVAASCGGEALDDGDPTTLAPGHTPAAVTLDGTSWQLAAGTVDGAALLPPDGRPTTLAVAGDRVAGSTGCNTFDATITIAPDGAVSFGDFAVTEIGCAPATMEYEAAMLAALRAVDRFEWDAARLTLSNRDESVTLDLVAAAPAPAPALDAVTWQLTGIDGGPNAASVWAGAPSPFLVIDLAAGAGRGNGGCNDFGIRMTLTGDQISTSDMVYTEIACDTAIMGQEAAYFQILARAASWQIDDGILTITSDAGDSLTFAPGNE